MQSSAKTRREFLKNSALAAAAMASTSLLSSCASFDDYLFDDKSDLGEEVVVIVGGGISGLYLAHQLRMKQIEFRMYEASPYLGGRIKSAGGHDYGASLLSKKDLLANALIDELKISRTYLDKDNFYLNDGMQTLVDLLKERIIGLIPYRNFRVRWQLIEIQKLTTGYELTFQLGDGQKKVLCQRIAIAIPPSQWGRVKGLLELPEMEHAKSLWSSMSTEAAIRLVLPLSALPGTPKSLVEIDLENFDIRQVVKKHTNPLPVELDIKYLSNVNFSIDYVYGEMKKKLQISYPFQKLNSDQFYGWVQAPFIEGAYFKMNTEYKASNAADFQLIGDSISPVNPNRIEGALFTAKMAAASFI